MDVNIYTANLSVDLIPKIKARFADFHMDVEFHPNFRFDEREDAGFLPIKLQMHKGRSKNYDDFGDAVLTGFELYINHFDYTQELNKLYPTTKDKTKGGAFSKIFGTAKLNSKFLINEKLDGYLKMCDKNVLLNFKSWNKSELRVTLFFGAILAEITSGIIYDPQGGTYFRPEEALEIFSADIEAFEASFTPKEFNLVKFEKW